MALLLWLVVLITSTLASPGPALGDAADATTAGPTGCSPTDSSPVFNTQYRSTIEILWSCLAIIFASTWVCVHPNVAGYNTTKWQRLWKRVKLFALAIFAPELLAVFAFFQWKGCRELHRDFKKAAEDLNISLVLNSNENAPLQPLQPEYTMLPLTEGVPNSGGSTPLNVHSETEARAGSWTRMMHHARHAYSAVEHVVTWYPVDSKETAWTLTHAHLVQMGGIVFKNPNGGNNGFKEPCMVKHPDQYIFESEGEWKERIEWLWNSQELRNFFALKLPEAAISDKSKGSALAKTLVVMQVLWFIIQTVARAVEGLPITHLEVVCLAFTAFNFGMYVCWWDKPLDVEYPLEIPGVPGGDSSFRMGTRDWMDALSGGLDELPVGLWIYLSDRRLYPGLYCYGDDSNESLWVKSNFATNEGRLGGTFTLALAFTSASFGALHCIGWSLPSPSPAEHMIWRISSLVLVSYPLVPLVFGPIRRTQGDYYHASGVGKLLIQLLAFTSALGGVAYIAARFILIALPFLELRSLPPLAHQTVSWSNFLPHL